jgi:pterin-4a-carbinolamine dehydratase
MIHDPVKKWKCDECSRHFTQKIHLRKHLEKHHPELNYEFEELQMKEEGFNDGIIFEVVTTDSLDQKNIEVS